MTIERPSWGIERMDLHTATNHLLDHWANNDRPGYKRIRDELEAEHGKALANTAAAVARFQIKRYNWGYSLPNWRW